MSKNHLIINHVEDSIQLSWLRGQAAPRSAPPVRLEHPFDEKVLAELRKQSPISKERFRFLHLQEIPMKRLKSFMN